MDERTIAIWAGVLMLAVAALAMGYRVLTRPEWCSRCGAKLITCPYVDEADDLDWFRACPNYRGAGPAGDGRYTPCSG